MSGYGSMNYNEQSSQQQSSSRTGLRGTQYAGNAATQANEQGMLMSGLNQATVGASLTQSPDAMFRFGQQALPGGKYGLGENADSGVEALGQYMHGIASGDYGQRGFLSPENRGAVTGSAMQRVLPQLVPQQQQFQLAQFMAPQNMMNMAKTSADYWNRALGAQSDASGSGSGFGFGVSMGGGAMPTGG